MLSSDQCMSHINPCFSKYFSCIFFKHLIHASSATPESSLIILSLMLFASHHLSITVFPHKLPGILKHAWCYRNLPT